MSRLARPLLFPFMAALAARFVAPSLLVALAGGCLWWPDIQERPDVRFGPTIDRSKVHPTPDEVVNLTTVFTQFSVVGAVADPDTPIETLEYHWYVAYPESDTPRGPDFIGQQSITFDPCSFPSDLVPFLAPHVLELIVSDQPIEFDPTRGRVITGAYAYVSWTFEPQVTCNP